MGDELASNRPLLLCQLRLLVLSLPSLSLQLSRPLRPTHPSSPPTIGQSDGGSVGRMDRKQSHKTIVEFVHSRSPTAKITGCPQTWLMGE